MANVDNDLEEVMAHLGEFGRYQAWQFFLHVIAGLTAGLHMLTLTTVAFVPPHHCTLPTEYSDYDGPTYSNDSSSVPRIQGSCHYIDINNSIIECSSWTYDTTYFQSSRAMEWNFVCSHRWMGALAQSSYMFGVFTGAMVLGSMADNHGRKIIFYISAVGQVICGITVAMVTEYYTFLAIRFLYGIFGSAGAYITGFVLTMELVGASKRTVCGLMFQLAFAVGFMLVAVWGSIISNDRFWLQIVYGLHGAALLGHWWLMDESPRWLWAQGRISEALKIVQKALRMNGSQVILDTQRYLSKSKVKVVEGEDTSYSAFDLLKTPNLRNKTLNVCLNWFANSIAYYGLALSSGNLIGNPHLMMFFSAFVEIPSYLFVIFVLDRTGRRSLISTLMLIGGICCITAPAIPENVSGGQETKVAIVLFGKACLAGSFAIIYNYTAELFPTVLRNTALGIGSMCARFAGALTPLMLLLDSLSPRVPATVFGLIALLAGFLALYLPETMDQPMPETLEDGENFGKGDTCFTTCFHRKVVDKRTYEVALQRVDDFEREKEQKC
ncbi:hypothetical protein QAD02_017743 [Eretmocerus hayati]|uniref:Uncharacterized protein n=1 Tax=Eretmocerus hayati TaxID=131215 RepID=A0ACC2PEQ9_9HYME|nr:hypothetical protein QAD02_017743 [Eretmocerus hayati]